MLGFSLLWALKKTLGYAVYVEPHVKVNLDHLFVNMPSLPSTDWLCQRKNDPWETFWGNVDHLHKGDNKYGKLLELPKTKVGLYFIHINNTFFSFTISNKTFVRV